MPGAGQMTHKATFWRRSLVPAQIGAARGGFDALGEPQWAHWDERGPRDMPYGGGLSLPARTGILTVEDSSFTRSITSADRVSVAGDDFEIRSVMFPAWPTGFLAMNLTSAPGPGIYGRLFDCRGEVVVLERGFADRNNLVQANVRAIVTGYQPDELVAGIAQGERKVLLSAADVAASAFPGPPQRNDRIVVRGRTLGILDVDGSSHLIGGTLLAYQIRAAG